MRRTWTIGGALLAAALAGCTSAQTPAASKEAAKLEGTNWVLVSDVPEGTKPATLTLQADGRKVVGFTGCNRMFGQYTLSGQALYFNAMGTTKMACPGPAMDLEKHVLNALTRARKFTIAGDTLSLRDDDTELLRFRAATP
jgi:heat shock protein HslJ